LALNGGTAVDADATRPVKTADKNIVDRLVILDLCNLRKTKSVFVSVTSWFAMWQRCRIVAVQAGAPCAALPPLQEIVQPLAPPSGD
jgi:hypothetical protein